MPASRLLTLPPLAQFSQPSGLCACVRWSMSPAPSSFPRAERQLASYLAIKGASCVQNVAPQHVQRNDGWDCLVWLGCPFAKILIGL